MCSTFHVWTACRAAIAKLWVAEKRKDLQEEIIPFVISWLGAMTEQHVTLQVVVSEPGE